MQRAASMTLRRLPGLAGLGYGWHGSEHALAGCVPGLSLNPSCHPQPQHTQHGDSLAVSFCTGSVIASTFRGWASSASPGHPTPDGKEGSSGTTPQPDNTHHDSDSATAVAPPSHRSGQAYPGTLPADAFDANSKAPLLSSQFPSSSDDAFGVQKNWFTALYKQLNYMAKTGSVPGLKDRQRVVFEQVEAEFERLYDKHIKGKALDADAHRALLMCCLSIATYRVLAAEVDERLVRDVIRTNLGSLMLALLRPVHRFKLWMMSWLLREDMYAEAAKMLPALQRDLTSLCDASIQAGQDSATLTVHACAYHDVFTQEDTPFLLSEFCCHHSLLWMHEFRRHGVVVSMDQSKVWDDACCQLRVSRSGQAAAGGEEADPPQGGGAA